MSIPKISNDTPLVIDELVGTRMLLTANSGGGKSWAIRRIVEQCFGKAQILIVDPEEEFGTLRSHFDVVIAGKGADCPAEPRSADLLARRLWEMQASAVLGIYELKHHERILFVRRFLEALLTVPKPTYHSCLLIIDEAHLFAPENGNAESRSAVIDVMTRGRKRGLCGILATQRPAMLAKDASAQAINKLIGRQSQDIDVKRAADDLGIFRREDQQALRQLKPGEFYAVGPAFQLVTPQVITVGSVKTAHPQVGARFVAPPPATAAVRDLLAKLSDLPQEAEAEAATVAQLQQRVRELEREVANKPKPIDVEEVSRAGYVEGWKAASLAVTTALGPLPVWKRESASPIAKPGVTQEQTDRLTRAIVKASVAVSPKVAVPVAAQSRSDVSLSKAERKILEVLAPYGTRTKAQIALMAQYTASGGGFNNAMGRLRKLGFISGTDTVTMTEAGLVAAGPIAPLPKGSDLLGLWVAQLSKAEASILSTLVNSGSEMAKDDVAAMTGYVASGGGFNNAIGRLRTLGLITGGVRGEPLQAAAEFFD